jgi:amino acid transporter
MLWLRIMENRRDSGLIRAVGPLALAASIINAVIGAGIFNVPAALAAAIGPYAPWAFVVCAFAIGAVAICFAEGGSRVPTSGGAYGYITAAFGPMTGFVAGTLLYFSNVLACGGISAALADAVVSVLPDALRPAAHAAVIVAAVGGIALVNLRGVALGARLINTMTLVKLIPLVLFLVVGAAAIHAANFVQSAAQTAAEDSSGVGRALILALFTFTGMETPICASGEVKNPTRTIPRALLMGLLVVTVIYVGVQVVAQGILGPALAGASVPLADAMARVGPVLRVLMLIGAAVSMFGWISSDILSSPRILFALSRDALLPAIFGRLHAARATPYVAILFHAALAMGLALTGSFAELAVLSTLAVAPLYIGACAAAWYLARRRVALAGEPLSFRWLGLAAVIGTGSMVFLVGLATWKEIEGLFGLIAAALALYFIQTRLRTAAADA